MRPFDFTHQPVRGQISAQTVNVTTFNGGELTPLSCNGRSVMFTTANGEQYHATIKVANKIFSKNAPFLFVEERICTTTTPSGETLSFTQNWLAVPSRF